MTDAATAVLIVGAGPAGLTAALELTRRGVPCRVVDRTPRPAAATGCYMLWPRTLGVLHRAGAPVGELARSAVTLRRKVFHLGGESFAHSMADEDGRWPLPLTLPQPVTEDVLTRALAARGVPVERPVLAASVRQDADGADVELRRPGGVERIRVRWVVLAQGAADDGLRTALGFGWSGEAVPGVRMFHLDVDLGGVLPLPPEEEHIFLADHRNIGFVPLPDGRHRLFTMEPDPDPADWSAPDWSVLAGTVREVTGMTGDPRYAGPVWRSRPARGLAGRFRSGRCFVVGETAKTVPMPVHGLNGGVQDAHDLAWKLADVERGVTGEAVLDAYDHERRAVARATIEHASRILAYGTHPDAEALHGPRVRTATHDVRTQPPVRYPAGELCRDAADLPGPAAGERLPDPPVRGPDGARGPLSETLGADWALVALTGLAGLDGPGTDTVRVRALADAYPELRTCLLTPGEPRPGETADPDGVLHRAVGADEPRVYVVRPDGHIGFRGPLHDLTALRGYLGRVFA
ncbi:FAD-dependent monooxygenase [Spirillospora sp. NPDC052242]